jgi:CxxC motif-containing protein (DUF1111 family)
VVTSGKTTMLIVTGVLLTGPAQGGTLPAAQPPAGDPLPGLTPEQLERFELGRSRFDRDFVFDEGLGPIFNQNSCGACHIAPLGGTGTVKVLRAGFFDGFTFDPLEEFGGSLFQLLAIEPECAETPAHANVDSDRVTNGMMGYGLVEAIPDEDLVFYQDNPPSSEVSGRAHMVEALEDGCTPCPPEQLRVGRFGWKAQLPTVLSFTADAALQEMGITNRFLPFDNDPNGIDPPELAGCDPVPDDPTGMTYEDGLDLGNGVDREFIDVTTDFQRFMVAPPQTPQSGMTGEALFTQIGCTDCHVASYVTADDPGLEDVLRNRTIRPYSDFLLHDMGLNADGIAQGDATIREIKTPPLWGLRIRPELWHDGRFGDPTRVVDAIAAHDDGVISEARFSARRFFNDDGEGGPVPGGLSEAERQAVLAFLDSLGRREFDLDANGVVEIEDFHGFGDPAAFKACYGTSPGPDEACALHDVDQSGTVDLDTDFMVFLTEYVGLLADCNGNGTLDLIDILDDPGLDGDDNGILDSCQPTCLGDTDGDGEVGVVEFMDLIATWGPCPDLPGPCPLDLDTDHVVSITDFLLLLSLWGPCP